jgi:nucleotide sugar dehydrogenase
VCAGTPPDAGRAADLAAIDAVIAQLARVRPSLVVTRSTVAPGTSRRHGEQLGDVPFAFLPEVMREGSALADLADPPVVVAAASSPEAARRALALRPLGDAAVRRAEVVPFELAELFKDACNTWHARKVVFANEVDAVGRAHGQDGSALMGLFVTDRALNLSELCLRPGAPFGGGCLPKDRRAFTGIVRVSGMAAPLVSSVRASKDAHQRRVLERVLACAPHRGIVDREPVLARSPPGGTPTARRPSARQRPQLGRTLA